MEYRSANPGMHISNDVVAGVGSSHGIQIGGGSTGGVVQTVADDTSANLTLKAKGLGTVVVGDSSNTVQFAGSTAPFAGFVRVISTAVATPNFNSTGLFGIVSTVTVSGVNSSHIILSNPINLSTAVVLSDVWAGSTANSVNLKWNKLSTVTVSASTATIRFLVFRF